MSAAANAERLLTTVSQKLPLQVETEMKQLGEETRKALVTTMSKTPLADLANLSSLATKRDERYRLVEKNARAMFKEAASGSGIEAVHGQHILSENLQGNLMDHAQVHLSDGQLLRIKKVAKERHRKKEELREQMDELFRVLDEDGNEKLTKDEVLRGAHKIGKTEEEARVLFEELAEGNGDTLTMEAFEQAGERGTKKFLRKSVKRSITEDDFVKWAMSLLVKEKPTVWSFKRPPVQIIGLTAFLSGNIINLYFQEDAHFSPYYRDQSAKDIMKAENATAMFLADFARISATFGVSCILYLAITMWQQGLRAVKAEDLLFLFFLQRFHLHHDGAEYAAGAV